MPSPSCPPHVWVIESPQAARERANDQGQDLISYESTCRHCGATKDHPTDAQLDERYDIRTSGSAVFASREYDKRKHGLASEWEYINLGDEVRPRPPTPDDR